MIRFCYTTDCQDIIELAYRSANPDLRMAVASNSNTPNYILRALESDMQHAVRHAAYRTLSKKDKEKTNYLNKELSAFKNKSKDYSRYSANSLKN